MVSQPNPKTFTGSWLGQGLSKAASRSPGSLSMSRVNAQVGSTASGLSPEVGARSKGKDASPVVPVSVEEEEEEEEILQVEEDAEEENGEESGSASRSIVLQKLMEQSRGLTFTSAKPVGAELPCLNIALVGCTPHVPVVTLAKLITGRRTPLWTLTQVAGVETFVMYADYLNRAYEIRICVPPAGMSLGSLFRQVHGFAVCYDGASPDSISKILDTVMQCHDRIESSNGFLFVPFVLVDTQVLPRDPLLPPPLPLEGESVQEMMAEVLRMISAAGCGTPEVLVIPPELDPLVVRYTFSPLFRTLAKVEQKGKFKIRRNKDLAQTVLELGDTEQVQELHAKRKTCC